MYVKSKKSNTNITIDDLIQEVVYLNSRKHKNISDKRKRKNILDNYFKSNNIIDMFPNKIKLEKAIKNINYEMEKASQEFSKLFQYETKK